MLKIPVGLKHISTVGFLLLKRKMCNYNEANGISSSVGRTFVSFFFIFPGFFKKIWRLPTRLCVSLFFMNRFCFGAPPPSRSPSLYFVFSFL